MWIYLFLAGLFGGLCGGMGLGGGTLLIPILTMILSVDQHLAQGLNLLVFIPTAIVALVIHAKNKLLNYKMFFIIVVPAAISAIVSSFLVKQSDGNILKNCFGGFLVFIAVYEIGVAIKTTVTNKKLFDNLKYKI